MLYSAQLKKIIHHNLSFYGVVQLLVLFRNAISIRDLSSLSFRACTFALGLHLFAPLCTSGAKQSKAKQSKAKQKMARFPSTIMLVLSLVFVLQNIPALADFIYTLTDSTGTPIGLAGVWAIVFGCIPIPGRPITLGHQTIFIVTVTGQLCRLPLTLFVSNAMPIGRIPLLGMCAMYTCLSSALLISFARFIFFCFRFCFCEAESENNSNYWNCICFACFACFAYNQP